MIPTGTEMHVLDIDLDFFLNERVDGRSDDISNRPDSSGLTPWGRDETTYFLEGCLNVHGKIPGAVVRSHNEVFEKWKLLTKTSELRTPFKVVHVDAHSDLGMGFPSWTYLHDEFLSRDVAERPEANEGPYGVNFGSWLAFAIGCQWISQLDFVINRNWHDDIPRFLLSDASYEAISVKAPLGVLPYGSYKLEIELMHIPPLIDSSENAVMRARTKRGEPTIPFNILTIENLGVLYSNTEWDYIFLSHSPGYVPISADPVLELIGGYVKNK